MQKSKSKQTDSSNDFKNYYEILELNPNASMREIQKSYQKLSLRWHPDKHAFDRKLAEKKFNSITQAFDVLSDPSKRSTYDELFNRQSSLETAYKIFDQFFGENEIVDESEQKFFNKHYPQRKKNYYKVLGVSKNATISEINEAYRKLVLKNHPKNNPNDQESKQRFIEINEAYQTLSNKAKRSTYDDVIFSQLLPSRAFNIFENFFEDKWIDMPSQVDFFQPIFNRRNRLFPDFDRTFDLNRRELGRLPGMELQNMKEGQSYHREEKYEKKNGKENHVAQTITRKLKDGQIQEEILKENILPSGERDIVKTIKNGDKVDTKTYHLKKDEKLPLQIRN